ncbi:MAG TPA: Spy/CpxP family protein refolding chaperone [Bryobacteraceae bacterium]
MKTLYTFLTILMAGALYAQQPVPSGANPPTTTRQQSAARSDYAARHLTRALNLTPDQQTKVKAIFADARQRREALAPKMREERAALKTAVQKGDDREIDRILHQNAQLNADVRAVHVKAMARVYTLLTPDQKTKFDQLRAGRFGRERHGQAKAGA